MDIGLIILIIIASVIGNIFKQSKRQGDGKRRQSSNTPKIEWPPFPLNGPHDTGQPDTETIRRRAQQSKPVFRKIPQEDTQFRKTVNEVKKYDTDQLTTIEGGRIDIGSTYENQDIPSLPLESSVYENMSAEYTGTDKNEVNNQIRRITASRGSDELGLGFNEESLIKGIIMAEVLSPPKCRR